MGAGYDKRVFYNLKDDHARRSRSAAMEPAWTFRVRRLSDGSVAVTLGDREHVMSDRQAEILSGMIQTVAIGHRDEAWFPKAPARA